MKRFVSANILKRFATLPDFLREMSSRLRSVCDCDGRGCVVCISGDAMDEAATALVAAPAAAPAPAQAEGWQPKLQAIVERMRKYANRDDNGYVIDTWADEIADLLPPSASDAEPE